MVYGIIGELWYGAQAEVVNTMALQHTNTTVGIPFLKLSTEVIETESVY